MKNPTTKVISSRIPSQNNNKYHNISNIRISVNRNDSKSTENELM